IRVAVPPPCCLHRDTTRQPMTATARRIRSAVATATPIADRVARLRWEDLAAGLDAHGCATTGTVLTAEECAALAQSYAADLPFRSCIVMARHGFGRGEYKYFAYPLPDIVAQLRAALYPPLAEIANRWNEAMGAPLRYPRDHAAFLKRCHD